MEKVINAFIDGLLTGLDPIGCIIGYATKSNPNKGLVFIGHVADKYSLDGHEGLLIPKQRSLDEQISKAFGDVVGLGTNVVTCGVLQLYLGLGLPATKGIDYLNQRRLARKLKETYGIHC